MGRINFAALTPPSTQGDAERGGQCYSVRVSGGIGRPSLMSEATDAHGGGDLAHAYAPATWQQEGTMRDKIEKAAEEAAAKLHRLAQAEALLRLFREHHGRWRVRSR